MTSFLYERIGSWAVGLGFLIRKKSANSKDKMYILAQYKRAEFLDSPFSIFNGWKSDILFTHRAIYFEGSTFHVSRVRHFDITRK